MMSADRSLIKKEQNVMSAREEQERDAATRISNRSRMLIAALMLALTAASGVAARKLQAPAIAAPWVGTPGHAQFSAIGEGPVHFTGRLDRTSVLEGGDGLVKMELVIRGDERRGLLPVRVPTDLVVVLDRSGSMSGPPITHALASIRELIGQLGAGDRFSLVTYSSAARTVIPIEMASVDARRRWLVRLDGIGAGGGTNMARGLDVATGLVEDFRQAGRVPRIVLLSDGHANEGDHSFEGLLQRARHAVRGDYALSTVGVGDGFDETLMTAMADAGTGNFYYVQRAEELGEIFASELASARENVASGLRVVIRPAAGVEVLDAAGYPLEREGDRVSFRPGSLFAGQERRIWVSIRVPAHRDAGDETIHPVGAFELTYTSGEERESLHFAETPVVSVAKGREQFLASIDKDAWEQGVVDEEIGELKQKVADLVRKRRPEEAQDYIESFVARQMVLNSYMKSERVDDAIEELEAIDHELAAEAAAPSAVRRNSMGKKYSAGAVDLRRVGAKY
ncbi:MAG: VWA domain-containing protein [Deltaproteobacteria bacterium]|nr:VWA domain-containing protein [Deltaproteobacteria bacterium]MBW2384019.1 VWA domain-containing protein [Deltaproteobacteria bacterium]